MLKITRAIPAAMMTAMIAVACGLLLPVNILASTEERHEVLEAEPRTESTESEQRREVLDAEPRNEGEDAASRHEVLEAEPRNEVEDAESRDETR